MQRHGVLRRLAVASIMAGLILTGAAVRPAAAAPLLTIERVTYNVIGLDSNDVTTGPNTFPLGVRVCNTGTDVATNVVTEVVWDSANPYIELDSAPARTSAELAAGACIDELWHAVVDRDPAAYDTTRGFHVTARADGFPAVSTPTPRELYVEQLISQNRNQVHSISGPDQLTVGDTVTFVLDASTAPGGYEQLETFLQLPPSIFEFVSIEATYSAPPGGTNDRVYADACGWDHDPTSATYRTCIGPQNFAGGKAGGDMQLRYTVRAIGAGTATLTGVIYDQSGASYHYNSDYGVEPNLFTVTVSQPAPTTAPPTTTTSTPAATTSTPTTQQAATTGLPRTGASSGRLALLALSLLSAGTAFMLLGTPRPSSHLSTRQRRQLELGVAAAELRTALDRHAADPAAAAVARLLVSVEAVAAALQRR